MDEQSGKTEEEEVMGEVMGELLPGARTTNLPSTTTTTTTTTCSWF